MTFDPMIREPLFDRPRRELTPADFSDANIGMDFFDCKISSIPDHAPYKPRIVRYVSKIKTHEHKGNGLILHGDFGTGKTGTAVAVAAEAMRRSGRAWFLSSWDIEETFRNSIGYRERHQLCAKKMQFLILDDIGVTSRKNKDSVDSVIALLIRSRSNARLPTLITTNLSIENLFAQYQSLQRLFTSKYIDVDVSGTDWVTGVEE